MPPENAPVKCTEAHQWPPCEDPNCVFRSIPGTALERGLGRTLNLALLNDELDYLARLVHVDQHRMIEARDHARSHGDRDFKSPDGTAALMPDLERAERLLHSFAMSRTAAVMAEIEDMEKRRVDTDAPDSDQPLGSPL